MQRSVDTNLETIKHTILKMGGFVEKALEEGLSALLNKNTLGFSNIELYEKKINDLHIQVDEMCLQILAKQSPLATDLRTVLAIIKINTDLERMGDQAMNISFNSQKYLSYPPLKPLIDLPLMAQKVTVMVRQSLDAFTQNDIEMAKQVLALDDEVDDLKDKIFKDVKELMKGQPDHIESGLNLILISRNLEKLGDHATNIAEDVIFAMTGKDIRHHHYSQIIDQIPLKQKKI